jgi:ATP-dependent DNA helicase RecG
MESEPLKIAERLSTGLELGESHFREFKGAVDKTPPGERPRSARDISKDIAETLVAFANADGGELFVGVEDDGTVSGMCQSESDIALLLQAAKTHVHSGTPLPSPTVVRFVYDTKTVLYFQTAKSTERVHLTADGRCLQRFDRENRPVPAEQIQYSRQEQRSREYDREFVSHANLRDLNREAVDAVSKSVAGGQSPEKFLQHMDTAEYGPAELRLRRAAVLLFAKNIARWHPRCEVRIVRVSGSTLGVGKNYNVNPRDDQTIRGNVLEILETAWETLRPYLARSRLVESGIFKESLIYPEDACKEALLNAIAHRDYSIEGKSIEIFIYDDRLEIKSPGGLLSSISAQDLRSEKRTHQSRNVYLTRVLRELGYMREIGEGMLRIFATMRDQDLVPPEIDCDASQFTIVLRHRSVFSPKDQEWLEAYAQYDLSRDEQRAVLLGRDGHALSTNEIIRALAIIDVDQFRQLVENLRRKGILYNVLSRAETGRELRAAGTKREVGRFGIRPPGQTEQYRSELVQALKLAGPCEAISADTLKNITAQLAPSSPYAEMLPMSLKLLGLIDERMRPLPRLLNVWHEDRVAPEAQGRDGVQAQELYGAVQRLFADKGFGFLQSEDGQTYFFHVYDFAERPDFDRLSIGTRLRFRKSLREFPGRNPVALEVRMRD